MVKVMKKCLACVFAAVLSCSLFAGCADEGGETTVSFPQKTMSVERFTQHSLEAVTDENYDGDLIYSCSDESVAIVSQDGLLTAVGVGSAMVTVQAGNSSATMQLNVRANTEEPVLNTAGEQLKIPVGQEFDLSPQVYYADEQVVAQYSFSSDSSAVTLSDGTLTGVSVGNATVTVKAEYAGITLSKDVGVEIVDGGYFFPESQSVTLYSSDIFGEGLPTSAEIGILTNLSGNVVWHSADESVATVANGTITAKNAGKTTVTATLNDVTEEIAVEILKPSATITQSADTEQDAASVVIDLTAYQDYLPAASEEIAVSVSENAIWIRRVVNGWIILDPSRIPIGERTLTVETKDFIVYVPIVCASLIIDNVNEFMQIKTVYFKGGENGNAENNDPLRDGYFILNADLDFEGQTFGVDPRNVNSSIHSGGAEAPWRAQRGWYGVFDGRGHVIRNIQAEKRGLFGNIEFNSVVKNVAFVNAKIHDGTDGNNGSNSGLVAEIVVGTVDNVLVAVESLPVGASLYGKAGICTTLYGKISNTVCIVLSGQNRTSDSSQPAVMVNEVAGNPIEVSAPRGNLVNSYGVSKGNLSAVNSVQYGVATVYQVVSSFADLDAAIDRDGFGEFWNVREDGLSFGSYTVDESALLSSI